jgi:hypothetical protein
MKVFKLGIILLMAMALMSAAPKAGTEVFHGRVTGGMALARWSSGSSYVDFSAGIDGNDVNGPYIYFTVTPNDPSDYRQIMGYGYLPVSNVSITANTATVHADLAVSSDLQVLDITYDPVTGLATYTPIKSGVIDLQWHKQSVVAWHEAGTYQTNTGYYRTITNGVRHGYFAKATGSVLGLETSADTVGQIGTNSGVSISIMKN